MQTNEFIKKIMASLDSMQAQFKTAVDRILKPGKPADPDARITKSPGDNGTAGKESRLIWYVLLSLIFLSLFNNIGLRQQNEIPYSQFISYVKEGKIEKAVVTDRYITGVIKADKPEEAPKPFNTIPLWQPDLSGLLTEHKVSFVVRPGEGWLTGIFFNWVIPIFLFMLIASWFMRRTTAGAQSFLNLGNKIKIRQDTQTQITFKDVAGGGERQTRIGRNHRLPA